jgi:hypothetical protein
MATTDIGASEATDGTAIGIEMAVETATEIGSEETEVKIKGAKRKMLMVMRG